MKTLLITGASGFIASHFIQQFAPKYHIVKLSHTVKPGNITFNHLLADQQLQQQIDVIVNLAGANIGARRWSAMRKHELIESRLTTTRQLVKLFNQLADKPHLISASATGIYDWDSVSDETSPIDYQHYANFSQQITKQWEQAALAYQGLTAITRFGVVLSSQGGAFNKILQPFLFGIGGKVGSGKQGFPWIALSDLLAALELIIDQQLTGVFNLVAPQHINNHELSQAISHVWHKPNLVTTPAWLIQLLFGQMGKELLLNGAEVVPSRLLQLGFQYKLPNLVSCLQAIKHQLV
jgi:uncharacterized protein (TIGR01777 family)